MHCINQIQFYQDKKKMYPKHWIDLRRNYQHFTSQESRKLPLEHLREMKLTERPLGKRGNRS